MGNLTDVVGGCTVENNPLRKYLLRKASVANPFGLFTLNEKVRVYSADFSEHFDGYVCDLPHDLGGGDWCLGIYILQMLNQGYDLSLAATTTHVMTYDFQEGINPTEADIFQIGPAAEEKYLPFTKVAGAYQLVTNYLLIVSYKTDLSASCSYAKNTIGTPCGAYSTMPSGGEFSTTSTLGQDATNTGTIHATFGLATNFRTVQVVISNRDALYAAFTTPSGLSIGHYASDTADDDGGLVLKTYVDDALVSTNNVPANGVVRLPRVGCDGKQMYFKLANKGTVMDSFKLNSLTVEYQDGGDRH